LGEAKEAACFFIDKHGGRNTYAAMLQDAVADGMVVAHEEGRERSVYSVLGLDRDIRLTFQPRADAEHFGVALASMVSKYLREILMGEFNQFWQTHVAGLKPTAGYPGDAQRFWEAIRPAAQRLNIAQATLWRRK
jgi:ribonuclease HII